MALRAARNTAELKNLEFAHIQIWACLCVFLKKDQSIGAEHKRSLYSLSQFQGEEAAEGFYLVVFEM